MAKTALFGGTTSYIANVFIQDSSQTDGRGLAGLVFNSGSLVASYVRPGAARVAITLVTQTVTGAYSSGGFVEVDATNCPGCYRLDVPNAALASGAKSVLIVLKGAANMAPCLLEFELTAVDNQDAGDFGLTNLDAAISSRASSAALATVQADTDDIQARIPAALVSGRIDSSVGAMAANVLTATAINADAITATKVAADVGTEIATAVWASGTRTLTSLSALATDIADAVWNAVATSYNAALSMGNKLNAAGSAGDPWTTALPGAYGAGTAGKLVGDNVNATISSRLPTSSYVDHTAAIAAVQADTDNIQTRVPAALVSGRIDASVGAMAANVLTAAATNADTGTEIAAAVRTELAVELARIDAAITTRLAAAGYTAPDNATITSISAFIDTEVAAILAAVDTEVAAIKAKTDNLPASPAAVGSAMTLDTTQTIADVGGAMNTLGGILSGMRAFLNGKLTIVSGLLKFFGQNGTTQIGVDRTITGTVPGDTTRQ